MMGSGRQHAGHTDSSSAGPGDVMTPALAGSIVDRAAARYFAERRRRVDAFVDRQFSVTGALALHRKALGADIIKAPLNIVLAVPYFAAQLGAVAARACRAERLSTYLRSRRILLDTAVGREIEWLVMTELLELPLRQGHRVSTKDALAEAIVAEQAVAEAIRARLGTDHPGGDLDFRKHLADSVARYTETRAASAEIATTLMTFGAGAAALKQITPGAMVLGPALAGTVAQQAAIASFPLGPTLGALWYAVFPAAASAGLVAGVTAGVAGAGAIAAAFVGVVTDPLQRAAGLHRRRLLRLIDALERQFATRTGTFAVRDHYVARLLGLVELVVSLCGLAKS
jgi:uncharacterized protein DUF6635